MTKFEFIFSLKNKLSNLPTDELDERLSFLDEMIDDRIEDGLSEDEAVLAIGSVEEVAQQIIADIPLSKIAKERIKPQRRLKAWEIVLIVLGSPIWFSILISALAVVFSLYVSLWAVVISLWAVFASLIACALSSATAGIGFIIGGKKHSGFALIGAALVCSGLCIFTFFSCKWATKATVSLAKTALIKLKSRLINKEAAQ